MRLAMESHTGGMPLCGLGAPETERVGATRSHDVEVGHTMGPPSERSHAASRNAITPRRSGLTTRNRLRYPSSAEATPELFHGTRDTTFFFCRAGVLTGISIFARRIRAFITPTRLSARQISSSHVASLPVEAALDVEPTRAPAFRASLRHRSTPMLFLRQADFVALRRRQPAGTGSAQILRSMSPNSRRVRCPSASRSQ